MNNILNMINIIRSFRLFL